VAAHGGFFCAISEVKVNEFRREGEEENTCISYSLRAVGEVGIYIYVKKNGYNVFVCYAFHFL